MIRKLLNINSIFGRLMISHLVIILLSLAVIGIMFGYLIQNYYNGLKEWEATNNSRRIASLVSENITEDSILMSDDISVGNMRSKINTIAHSTNMDIGLMDEKGKMVLNVSTIKANLNLEAEEIKHILAGNTFTKKIMGPDYRYLLMTVPLIKTDNEIKIMEPQQNETNPQVIGAVLIQTPLGNISATVNNIMRFILYSFLVALAAAIFLSLSFSKKITKPLDSIKEAALKSTEGKVKKVHSSSNSSEEINHLVNTYNYAAKQINRTLEKQKHLEKMQKQFVANVSHEFRAPLTSIKGFLEILLEQDLSQEEIHEYVQIMYKDTEHLENLLSDLLVLSKLDKEKNSLNLKKTAPSFLINKAVESMKNKIEENNMNLTIKIEDELPEIEVDQGRIHQVLINLIDNAVNYSKPNSDLIIKAKKIKENNLDVKFSVIDNGSGIPEDKVENIWDRFYIIDRARTREEKKEVV